MGAAPRTNGPVSWARVFFRRVPGELHKQDFIHTGEMCYSLSASGKMYTCMHGRAHGRGGVCTCGHGVCTCGCGVCTCGGVGCVHTRGRKGEHICPQYGVCAHAYT